MGIVQDCAHLSGLFVSWGWHLFFPMGGWGPAVFHPISLPPSTGQSLSDTLWGFPNLFSGQYMTACPVHGWSDKIFSSLGVLRNVPASLAGASCQSVARNSDDLSPPHSSFCPRVRHGPKLHAWILPTNGQRRVEHASFDREGICRTKLVVQIWVPDEAVSLCVETPTKFQAYATHLWTGMTRHVLQRVEPRVLTDIELEVGLTAPGWHTISGVTLSWGRPHSPPNEGSRTLPACLFQIAPLKIGT